VSALACRSTACSDTGHEGARCRMKLLSPPSCLLPPPSSLPHPSSSSSSFSQGAESQSLAPQFLAQVLVHRHDGHPLGVARALHRVFEPPHEVVLCCFLKSVKRLTSET